VPEGREHAVERIVGERQLLGVALDELDLDARGGGLLAPRVEQLRRQVEPGHLRAGPGRRQGRVARAAATSSTSIPAPTPARSTTSSPTWLMYSDRAA